jgi:hypothetical protein
MYRRAPLTDRRIFWGALSIPVSAGAYFVFYDLFLMALIMCICGLALVPISFTVRAYAVKRMMAEYEGV